MESATNNDKPDGSESQRCHICGSVISRKNSRHIYWCADRHGISLSREDIRFQFICYNAKKPVTASEFNSCYLEREYSLPDFEREFGLAYSATQFLIDYFGLSRRSIADAANSQRFKDKHLATFEARYGVDNPSKSETVKAKKRATFMAHYGVDNIRKSPEFVQRSQEVKLAKYGRKSVPNRFGNMNKWWKAQSADERRAILAPAREGSKRYWRSLTPADKDRAIAKRVRRAVEISSSGLERRIASCLSDINVLYMAQFFVRRYSYDFKIKGSMKLIEVQGDYWHANPALYPANAVLNHGIKRMRIASEIWQTDQAKRLHAERFGYEVIYLWESDLRQLSDDQLRLLLKDILN